MLYYEDHRYTIIQKRNGMYDIYNAKYGDQLFHKNMTKEWTDQFIQDVLNFRNRKKLPSPKEEQNSKADMYPICQTPSDLTTWNRLDTVSTGDLAAKLLEKEDFSNYKYPWLAKIIQLSLEYLTLEGLADAYRSSQIPDEILDICANENLKTK